MSLHIMPNLTRLTDRLNRGFIIPDSILTAGLAFLLIPLAGGLFAIALLSAVMGVGLVCRQPLSITTACNASPITRTGEVLGLRLAVNRLSQMIAPLFFGLLGTSAGVVSVFCVSGEQPAMAAEKWLRAILTNRPHDPLPEVSYLPASSTYLL
ncbi:hypothetical protein GE107_18130 [Cohnella sp. CFH 77786]|uniref:MFS transporter n=1 Tax=Cohnella sp. CFH 77786 TaxID=2662265 RepID=UPI001C61042F|nr:MFS transporter [Cohnella sp. CFH 77786]MBW5447977.1 hypothetical protein [Cohnella sp. CFH 77786]